MYMISDVIVDKRLIVRFAVKRWVDGKAMEL